MKQTVWYGLALLAAFNSVVFVSGVSIGSLKFGADKEYDTTFESVRSNIYNIITSINTGKKGKCTKQLTVTGNGVGDSFEHSCNANGVVSITSDKLLVYGTPKVDPIALYSEEPSVLIIFKEGKCAKKTYKTVSRKTFGTAEDLSEEECKKIEQKITYILEQQKKYLNQFDIQEEERPAKGVKPFGKPSFKGIVGGSDKASKSKKKGSSSSDDHKSKSQTSEKTSSSKKNTVTGKADQTESENEVLAEVSYISASPSNKPADWKFKTVKW